MNARHVLKMALATVALAACGDDPAAAGTGDPAAIVTNARRITVIEDASFSITAYAVDESYRRMTGALAATSAGPAVTIDSVVYVRELAETRVYGTATTVDDGTDITITGHNLSTTTTVVVD